MSTVGIVKAEVGIGPMTFAIAAEKFDAFSSQSATPLNRDLGISVCLRQLQSLLVTKFSLYVGQSAEVIKVLFSDTRLQQIAVD